MASGREEPYDSLVTTLPLPETFRLLKDTPDTLRHAASLLARDRRVQHQHRH